MTALPAPATREAGDGVDVWMFVLGGSLLDGSGPDESVLAADETERAARFRFDHDRRRFVRRRALLRHLLAAYTSTPAGALRFVTNAYGKPRLNDASAPEFSASSSGDRVAVAISRHQVGVDVELVRPGAVDADVARRLFAEEEVAAISSPEDFFRCWTRKEAYVKALGLGLSYPLQAFAVDVSDVARPALLRSPAPPQDRYAWTVADLSSSREGYASAVVIRRADARINKCVPGQEGVAT